MRNDNPQMGRSFLLKLREVARELGLKESDVRPQVLKVHQLLTTSANSYKFNLAARTGTYALDNLLQENDFFVATGVALGLLPVPVISTGAKMGNAALVFYPDVNIFDTAAATGFVSEASALEAIYNSTMNIVTNQDVRVKDLPCNIFRDVPETQQTATTKNNYDTIPFKDLYTGLGFAGGNVNEIEIKFPSEVEFGKITGDPTTIVNYVALVLQGVILVGGAQKATAGRIYQLLNSGK